MLELGTGKEVVKSILQGYLHGLPENIVNELLSLVDYASKNPEAFRLLLPWVLNPKIREVISNLAIRGSSRSFFELCLYNPNICIEIPLKEEYVPTIDVVDLIYHFRTGKILPTLITSSIDNLSKVVTDLLENWTGNKEVWYKRLGKKLELLLDWALSSSPMGVILVSPFAYTPIHVNVLGTILQLAKEGKIVIPNSLGYMESSKVLRDLKYVISFVKEVLEKALEETGEETELTNIVKDWIRKELPLIAVLRNEDFILTLPTLGIEFRIWGDIPNTFKVQEVTIFPTLKYIRKISPFDTSLSVYDLYFGIMYLPDTDLLAWIENIKKNRSFYINLLKEVGLSYIDAEKTFERTLSDFEKRVKSKQGKSQK